MSVCFWLLSRDQYDGQSCCGRKNGGNHVFIVHPVYSCQAVCLECRYFTLTQDFFGHLSGASWKIKWVFLWILNTTGSSTLFSHCLWALSVIWKQTSVWVAFEGLVPNEVLVETGNLSGEYTVAVKTLIMPKQTWIWTVVADLVLLGGGHLYTLRICFLFFGLSFTNVHTTISVELIPYLMNDEIVTWFTVSIHLNPIVFPFLKLTH